MSPGKPSLRERFSDDLRSGSLPVLLTAVPLAMVVGLGSGWYLDDTAVGFLLLVAIGAVVPYVHETHWAQDRSWGHDVAWTVAASGVAAGAFGASYLLAAGVLGESIHTPAIAFVASALCVTGLGRLARRRLDYS